MMLLVAAVMLTPALVATSAEAKPTRYRVGIRLSDTNVVVGDTVRFSGNVRPLTTGKVVLQQRVAGKWRKLKKVDLVASGYAVVVTLKRPGVSFFRVVAPGGKGHKKGVSKTRTVRVLNNATNPAIKTASLPNGGVGTPYSATVETTDGRAGTWSISQGSLPPGLTIAPATGVISGTPTTEGTSEFGVFFRDTDGRVSAKLFTLTIGEDAPDQLIVTTSLPDGVKDAPYSAQLKAKDDRAGTWSISAGTLPAGLTLTGSSGVISGTPTTAGSTTFTVTFTDGAGLTATKVFTIVIQADGPAISTDSLPKGKVGEAYSAQLKTADGRAGTWAVSAGTLPTGLTLDASTGVISGTPTERDTFDFTVKFTDGAGLTATKALSIRVQSCLLIVCF